MLTADQLKKWLCDFSRTRKSLLEKYPMDRSEADKHLEKAVDVLLYQLKKVERETAQQCFLEVLAVTTEEESEECQAIKSKFNL